MSNLMNVRSFLLFLTALVVSCISYGEPVESMTDHFHIRKNQVERDAILCHLKSFETGSTTIETVKIKLGPAYSEVPNFGPKGMRMEKIGTILTYYLVKKDEDLVNSKTDEYIMFIFDNGGTLSKIIKRVKEGK